jgi:signal transduction histidine kinase
LVLSAVDRSDDLAARDRLLLAIAVVSIIAGAAVVIANRRAMRRAVQPLSELARRVRSLEPGAGERVRMHTDVAEVELLAQRFDDLVERFEQALTREKRFAAEASHELRTPLTIARAEIEALPRSDGTARALRSLERLAALVDALLWFARAQARLDRDHLDVVNLADLVREQVEEATRNGHTDSFSLLVPDEALARGDEHLLRRSLANLIDNAVKYGGNAPIRVELRRIDDDIVLTVQNGGTGIPDALREQIFEPFFRVSGQASSTTGFGLGLPLARAVARAHGGDVLLSDTPAGVTELLLRLPLAGWNELAAEQPH